MPTFVVEVDERFDSVYLQKLLLFLKHLGDDEKLLKPVVVLSSSRAAFGLDISYNDLRASFIAIDDLTVDECRMFYRTLLKNVKGTEDEKTKAIDLAISAIGNRLVYMHSVAAESSNCTCIEEFKSVVEMYEKEMLCNHRIALRAFKLAFPNIDRKVLLKVEEQELVLDNLCEIIKTTDNYLVQAIEQVKPHVLYVDPCTKRVSLGSHFMKKLICPQKN